MKTASHQTPVRKYPIGIQTFDKLRSEGYLYVDKTALVYQLASTGTFYFLSRPRRFGKSLLLSTLKAYFEGKREAFEGLAIEKLEKNWTVHPVLHFSLNAEQYIAPERLHKQLDSQLLKYETLYGTEKSDWTYSVRLMNLIEAAYKQTGHRAVVLIDEYDKPMLESMHDPLLQEEFRGILISFYSVLKDADPYLRLVFITGVTKFAQVSIFSTLNQLMDISLEEKYEALCGMTRKEIEENFTPELETLATREGTDRETVMEQLTRMYDGYHFCEARNEGIFNPFSVLSVFAQQRFRNYWFATGTPTFLVKMLLRTGYDIRQLVNGIEVGESSLTAYRASDDNPVPMLYQSGYLTIKDYNPEFFTYKLEFPNNEVRYGLLEFMASFYTSVTEKDIPFNIVRFVTELRTGKTDAFMKRLRAFFASMSYELSDDTERHYQAVFYIILTLLGQFTQAEIRSCHGRADAIVKTQDYIYIFEFKLNGTAEEAIKQINDKGYLIPYTTDSRKLVKVGAAFDKTTRNIEHWIIE